MRDHVRVDGEMLKDLQTQSLRITSFKWPIPSHCIITNVGTERGTTKD